MSNTRLNSRIFARVICILLSALWALAIFPPTPASAADLNLRRMPTPAEKKVLCVFRNGSEAEAAAEACKLYKLGHEHANGYGEALQKDLSAYHTVISGGHDMHYFGEQETHKQEAFAPLVKFMRNGGHLIIMGSDLGRHNEHLEQFGIACSNRDFEDYTPTPATGLFFKGASQLIPAEFKMFSRGSFTVSAPYVALMNRGKGRDISQPAMVTMAHQQGRLTFNSAIPSSRGDFWLITALINWVARGSLTPGIEAGQLPVPDAAAITSAETLIHEGLKDEYKQISEPMGKQAWAQLMLTRDFSQEADPAVQYVAWTESWTQAAAIGNLALAMEAVDMLASSYQIDTVATKAEILSTVSRVSKNPEVIRQAVQMVVDLQADAIARDNFPGVAQLTPVARTLVQKVPDKHLAGLVPYYERRAKSLTKEFQKLASKSPKAKATPGEDDSLAALGRYCCFTKADWSRGLPLLATCKDVNLQSLAERELARPTKGSDQLALADQWWVQAEDLPTEQRGVVQRHAAAWYYKSLADISPAQQSAIRKKLNKVPTAKGQLLIQVTGLRGKVEFTLTPEVIYFTLFKPDIPEAMRVNDFNWDTKGSRITNDGATRVLPDNIDIGAAKLTPIRGRGTTKLTHTNNGLVVTIDDVHKGGPEDFEFKLTFGGK